MTAIACIVGSGFPQAGFEVPPRHCINTPFGMTSSPVHEVRLDGTPVLILVRHGLQHQWAPHVVNYRANLWALRELGVRHCIGMNVVGGIDAQLGPGVLTVPHQLIDYTWGRESSFGAAAGAQAHIEFTEPFSGIVRAALEAGCVAAGLPVHRGVYGVTQGPRLETAAEIDRLERDGCAMVGMTALPEAALAREAGLEYGVLAGVVNHAAGKTPAGQTLHAQMHAVLETVMAASRGVLSHAAAALAARDL